VQRKCSQVGKIAHLRGNSSCKEIVVELSKKYIQL
jgi:hypothetical protein